MSLLLTCLLIIVVRIIDVSLGTVRMVLSVRGKKLFGSLIGFIEVLIWFLIVREALVGDEFSIWIALSYAAGFSLGTYIGIWLEEKLAIGSVSIQVITKGIKNDAVKKVRAEGFAVSTVVTQGKDQENLLLMIEVNRKEIKRALKLINKIVPDSFITVSDIKHITGGYFPNRR